jgi:chromosomal replication initiation ATPase DnaA
MDRNSAPAQQLPLELPLESAQARDDLVVGAANKQAVAYLDAWPEWAGPVAILAGPVGCGKTHLAKVWAERSDALVLTPSTNFDLPLPEDARAVVVEDLIQGAFSENWLFHIFNAVRQQGGSLLLTSRRWPGDWGISLPDLKSRLKTAHLLEIAEPDDALLRGVMAKLFADRQLMVAPQVIDYIALRMERSLKAAQQIVDELDHISMANKRAITRPLAAEGLTALGWKP